MIKYHTLLVLAVLGLFLLLPGCDIEEITDLNNPSLASVTNDASRPELQVLVTGLEARHRTYYQNATELFGSFGRETWAFFASDPRFIDEWLAIGIDNTYPDFFNSAGTYVSPYLAVKQANVLIASAAGSTTLTDQERNGYTGLAKTIKGYQLLWPLLQQGTNGIRIDVEDPFNPGPTLGFDAALQEIRDIIDEGATELADADIIYSLTEGFPSFGGVPGGVDVDFATAEGLLSFNRAIAAKAALYAEDWSAVTEALDDSYLSLDVDTEEGLNYGPVHPYGNSPDVNNPLFYRFNAPTNTLLIVHPAMIEDAIEGDGRLAKFALRSDTLDTSTAAGTELLGTYQDARWDGPTDNIPYLRNEELILMYAEAQAQLDNSGEAVDAINIIRNVWGIGDYSGDTDQEALIDEILFQRRYSLWAEAGQRWIDLRRYDRLNGDNVDLRDGGNLFTQVSRRISEISWDEGN